MYNYKSKIEILSYISNICLNGFVRKFNLSQDPISGDLIALTMCNSSEWYLSWYINNDGDNHILKSIETGKIARWSNVGLQVFDRETLEKFPNWKWTDKQHEFNDKWFKAFKRSDKFDFKPMLAHFEDKKVTLKIRQSFSNEIEVQKTFDNWKILKINTMVKWIKSNDLKFSYKKAISKGEV